MWLQKLERKYGKYAIHNLMMYITVTMLVVYGLSYFTMKPVYAYLTLSRAAVFRGEIWRLITFIFVPTEAGGVFTTLIYLYCCYSIGATLEQTMGSFYFNVYYLCGMLSAILSMLLFGYGTSFYLNLTIFLAYAYFYPDQRFLFLYFIPVRAKILAYLDCAVLLLLLLTGSWTQRASILLALANFLLFFGKTLLRKLIRRWQWRRKQREFQKNRGSYNDPFRK